MRSTRSTKPNQPRHNPLFLSRSSSSPKCQMPATPKRSSHFESRSNHSRPRSTPVPDFNAHYEDVDEIQDHVFMAVNKSTNGRIGCAYYIARHELLCCMQDIERGGFETIQLLILDIQPTILLISPQLEDVTALNRLCEGSSLIRDEDEQQQLPYEIVLRPIADFNYDNAITKLSSLDISLTPDIIRFLVPGENSEYDETRELDEIGLTDQQGRLLFATSSLDVENKLSIGCVGAVMGYIQKRRTSEYLQQDPAAEAVYRISHLEMFTLKNTMLLNGDTFSSLQILQSETHPSIFNQGPSSSGSKESLSVYGLFHNLARTPQGKLELRKVFLRPSLDLQILRERLDFISVFLRPENQLLRDAISKSLSRIKNMHTTVTSLKKGVERGSNNAGTIKSGVWAALLEFCYHSIDIADALNEVVGLQDLSAIDNTDQILDKGLLRDIGGMIHDIVDLDTSLYEHRTVVKRGINAELDKVKDAYDGMEEILSTIAQEITNTMPRHIDRRLNVVFLPQLGFHVTVPLDETTKEAVWEGDNTWETRFRTEEHQYFKNDQMRRMDSEWGDLYAVICDTEIEISHDLAQRVLQNEEWIIRASEFCGKLDCLLAMAHGAHQYNLTRPRFVEENIIDIKGGRHILQEMTVGTYVPNDTYLAGGSEDRLLGTDPTLLLLTGPNYSGKSVYTKQVALIVYMAQIGCFVPASSAVLGITDKILTRINTAETVSRIQSAFLIDLQQISWALKSSTNRSLLVIDEFGKGTDSCDGAGLAAGVLRYLLELGPDAPKTIACTHFHEIFERNDFVQYSTLGFAHMEVHINTNPSSLNDGQTKQLTYLYNLKQGRSTMSYGNQCAINNGIPQAVVDRAMLLADMVIKGEDLVAVCASLPLDEVEDLQIAEEVSRNFLGKDLTDDATDIWEVLEDLVSNKVPNDAAEHLERDD